MQVAPYLFFNDYTCRAAMTFYAEVFGGTLEIMDFASMPEEDRAQMPGVPDDAVMHAALSLGGQQILASDETGEREPAMAGCRINVTLPDEATTRAAFEALADGGEVQMPLMAMFWTPAFGTLTDKFGTRWMLMSDGPDM